MDSLLFPPGDVWLRDLIAAPGDHVICLQPSAMDTATALFVVRHHRHGVWTHVYRVDRQAGRAGGLVRLLRVLEGNQVDDAVDWAERLA